ncbi:DUF2520 domain-containing protein [Balneolales bacterium ANBcel1]|nr:DUF2520 domain-containing protein [Balneolales bacterium ANBcel1]
MTPHESSKQKFPHGFSVIGTGRLGSALAVSLLNKNYRVHSLFNRSEEPLRKLVTETDVGVYGAFPRQRDELGDLVFIAVPDDRIAAVAEQAADQLGSLEGTAWVHTSGATPSEVLKPLADRGAKTAAFHPVQTFNGLNRHKAFDQCFVTLQGDSGLCLDLKQIVRVLGARPLIVDFRQKTAIHLAAVMVCNYYATLFSGTRTILDENGVEVRSRELFGPMVRQTVEALLAHPPEEVLTGPVVRGDFGSVERHLKLLEALPEWNTIYRNLGRATLELARKRSGRDPDADRQLELLFSEE